MVLLIKKNIGLILKKIYLPSVTKILNGDEYVWFRCEEAILSPVTGTMPLRKVCGAGPRLPSPPGGFLIFLLGFFVQSDSHLPCIQLLNTNTLHLVCAHDAQWGPTVKELLEPVRLQGGTGDVTPTLSRAVVWPPWRPMEHWARALSQKCHIKLVG